MSKGFLVVITIISILFIGVFSRIYTYDEGLVPVNFTRYAKNYIKRAGCQAFGGKPRWNCSGNIKCVFPAKDYNKSCNNSKDCKHACVISDLEISQYCQHVTSSNNKYLNEIICNGAVGHCEKFSSEEVYAYEEGHVSMNFEGGCPL